MSIIINLNDENFKLSTQKCPVYGSITPAVGTYNNKILLELTYYLWRFGVDPQNYQSKTISFAFDPLTSAGDVVFELSEIFKTIVTPMIMTAKQKKLSFSINSSRESIHNLPVFVQTNETPIYSWSILSSNSNADFGGNGNVMDLKFYEMYSTTPTGIPVKDVSSEISKKVFMMWGRANESDPVLMDFSEYKMDGVTKKFLSSNYNIVNGTAHIDIAKDELHTLAFLNRCEINNVETYQLDIDYYDSSDVNIGNMTLVNASGTGGYYNADHEADALQTEAFFLFVGAGLQNFENLNMTNANYTGVKPSSATGGIDAISYYTIQMKDPSLGAVSMLYRFNIKNYCDRYERTRLAFMNRYGAWEYMTFNKEKTSELQVEKTYTTKSQLDDITNFSAFDDAFLQGLYPKNVASAGKFARSVTSNETFTLHTDYLESYEIDMIKDLFMSPQIHLLEGAEAKGLILDTSTMKLKENKETGLFKYELKFSFAVPKYATTQS